MARRRFKATGWWHFKVYAPTSNEHWLYSYPFKRYSQARAAAEDFAQRGHRARIIDPDGGESADLPIGSKASDEDERQLWGGVRAMSE